MYKVEIHSFNEGGHYHYCKYFEDSDYKNRTAYVEEELKEYFKYGYNLDDIYQHHEIVNNMDNSSIKIALLKLDKGYEDTAEIIIRKIVLDVEYRYEC